MPKENAFVAKLKSADMFSKKVELLIKKEEGHKTLFGSFLTLGLLTLLAILAYNMLDEMISLSKPSIIISDVYKSHPDLFHLQSNNFTLAYGLEYANQSTFIDESIYVAELVQMYKYSIEQVHINLNFIIPESQMDLPKLSFNLLPFRLDLAPSIKLNNLNSQTIQNLIIYPLNTALTGIELTNQIWKGLLIPMLTDGFKSISNHAEMKPERVLQFYNVLSEGQPVCKSPEVIHDTLVQGFFSLQISTSNVDLKDPYNPHTVMGKDAFTTTSNQMLKQIDLYMKPVTTVTDYGYVQEDLSETTTLKYQNYFERLTLGETDTFMRFILRLENVHTTNHRSYIKLQDILSELGGLWEILFIIFEILSSPINTLSYKVQILNSLFNFEGADQVDDEEEDEDSKTMNKMKSSMKQSQMNKSLSKFASAKKSQTSLGVKQGSGQDSPGGAKLFKLVSQKMQLEQIGNNIGSEILSQDIEIRKKQTMKNIQKEIKKYFASTSKKLKLNCGDYISFCCNLKGKNKQKNNQIQFSMGRVTKSFDILYIIKKLNELDKLKMILLTREQVRLFDYLPKPTIEVNPYDEGDADADNYWSILKKEKSTFQSALDAQKAYKSLVKQGNDSINKKLIQMMDPNIISLFQLDISLDQNDMKGSKEKSPKQEKQEESECEYIQEVHEERFNQNQFRDSHQPQILSARSENSQMMKQ